MPGKIHICLTVDWEGESLEQASDLTRMRKQFKTDVPLTHFICPNYFVQEKTKTYAKTIINTALNNEDEIGLHVHCFRNLIESVDQIPFRTEQNYHNTPGWFEEKIVRKIFTDYSRNITGRGVPLSVYEDEEIRSIIGHSRNLLMKNLNLEQLNGFRAGGWIANDNVLDIVAELGFRYDSSAVAPSILSQGYTKEKQGNRKDDYGDSNGVFTEQILQLWGYKVQSNGFLKNAKILEANNKEAIKTTTQAFGFNKLKMIPNNCGLTDFCSPTKTVLPLIKTYLRKLKDEPEQSFLIVYGCHQEGDYFYKQQLVKFVNEVVNSVSKKSSLF